MALINKIREKTGVAVGVIAIGLGLFVVGGDLLAPNSMILGGNKQIVGEINGVDIGLQEFQNKVEELKSQYALQNQKAPSEAEMEQIREQAWNQLIFEIAYKDEFDRVGIKVTDEELVDMVQGENIHPALREAFTNPETGVFDRTQIINFLQNIDRVEPAQKALWFNFEANIGPDRLRTKYTNLIKSATYVTTEEAKRNYATQSAKASLEYVYVPYYALPDSAYQVSDAELNTYLKANKPEFKAEGLARIKYVTFPIIPTTQDSTAIFEELASLRQAFQEAEDDTLFVKANSDVFSEPKLVNPGELPQLVQNAISEVDQKTVLGPFLDGNSFKLFKLSKATEGGEEFARASHILLRWTSESDEDKKTALKKANDILKDIQKGASFEEMAAMHGTDGTSSQGGDLGWFGKGRMVAEFEEAVFNAKSKGLLPKVIETQFGYHLIKITETAANLGFHLATVELILEASDNTRDQIYSKAAYFASGIIEASQFESRAEEEGLMVQEAISLKKTDKNVNTFANARELVRWAFNDATLDAISDVKEIDNNFVIASLTLRKLENEHSIDQFRDEITVKVRNQKKADAIVAKLKTLDGTLEEIAKNYGSEATYNAMGDLSLGSSSLTGVGFEPKMIGMAFGLQDNQTFGPYQGDNGVFIIKTISISPAAEISDYTQNKSTLLQTAASRSEFYVTESIKDAKGVKDFRYKFF